MYRSYRNERIQDIKNALTRWMNYTCLSIEGDAKHNAPRYTGDLARSVKSYVEFPVSTVAINQPYAKYVEGYPVTTRRHFVSWRNNPSFERWARRKYGADTSRPGGLLVWGYATKFFSNAIDSTKPKAMLALRNLKI
jgi:hypothetical protein